MQYCNTYSTLLNHHGKGFRHYARHLALDGLALLNRFGLDRQLKTPRIHFLYFHHIFKDEERPFESLVSNLAKDHEFISYSEAADRIQKGNVDRPYICWSSDDGFKNNLAAAAILERYGASCCFFVNPSTIGLTEYEKIKSFCHEKLNVPPISFLNWEDVDLLLKNGHEIGGHTMYHDMVAAMPLEAFEDDLLETKKILESKCGQIKHFAYPYGGFQHFTPQAFETVFEEGYETCASAVRGCHIVDQSGMPKNKLLIRRDQIIAAWNPKHIAYFIGNSVKKMQLVNNSYPQVG
ncbi:polysaccharide deacetylase family protein [Sediminicola luteus]|uniref:NodB homology domain-containing protein n=1 Tax=Sediminicola luteus TaxID=319238 RepID=A0A2A4G3Q7_9FLAO|nr:polysaccharide deacetylase family protein [Sediminicola luteus]PCE62614.1 hypothetical protein B7P33_18450 [Sediminicola luteus]